MKFRLDFVTNSSSSSYICDICGDSQYTQEIPEYMTYCEDGDHLICKSHVLMEEYNYGHLGEGQCPICNFSSYAESDMAKYLLTISGISREEVFTHIYSQNKRRKKLYDNEYITYVCERLKIKPSDVLEEIRNKFSSYQEFSDSIWGVGV